MDDNAALIISTIDKILALHHLNSLTPKKTHKDGGEYCGPCPRCKMEGRGSPPGGNDRLIVKPGRPAISVDGRRNGSSVFFCRQCPQENGHAWSGDLVQFVADTTGVSKAEALHQLGFNQFAGSQEIAAPLEFKLKKIGEQAQLWQERGNVFVERCQNTLWSGECDDILEYLRGRGETDDSIRLFMLGWNDEAIFDPSSLWGLEGSKLFLPRGVVIPEYHLNEKTKEMELHSIAIRRPTSDIDAEYEADTRPNKKKPPKYHVVRGSNKGLYLGQSMKPGTIAVLCEGQFDGHSVLLAGDGRFSVGATQSAFGARDRMMTVLKWISRADGVLLCFDPDDAGQKAARDWKEILPDALIHPLPQGENGEKIDLNTLYVQGKLTKFLEIGERRLRKIIKVSVEGKNASESSLDEQEGALIDNHESSVIENDEGHLLTLSETNNDIERKIDAIFEVGCIQCGGPIDRIDIDENGQPFGVCAQYSDCTRPEHPCRACGLEGAHQDKWGSYWCRVHVASYQLINYGDELSYRSYTIPAMPDAADFSDPDNVQFVETPEFQLLGGMGSYLAFAVEGDIAQIWAAAYWIHAISNGAKPYEPEKPPEHPCARYETAGCKRDTSVRKRISNEMMWVFDKVEGRRKQVYKYQSYGSRLYVLDGTVYHFCYGCQLCGLILEFGDVLGFPAFREVESGKENWIRFVLHSTEFNFTYFYDEMRRNKDMWSALESYYAENKRRE